MKVNILRRKYNNGFTLLEVIVPLAILALAVAGLMRMQISSTKLCAENTATLRCLAYASSEIEKIDSEELLTGQSVYKNEQVDEIGNPTKITVTATGKSSSYSMLPVDTSTFSTVSTSETVIFPSFTVTCPAFSANN